MNVDKETKRAVFAAAFGAAFAYGFEKEPEKRTGLGAHDMNLIERKRRVCNYAARVGLHAVHELEKLVGELSDPAQLHALEQAGVVEE